jgi:ABC-type transporter Mla subunit MlaD
MSTLKSVGNKLFKTELNSQRVELGVVEDIAKIADSANALLKTLQADKVNLINSDKAIQDAIIQAKKIVDTANANADKLVSNTDKNAAKGLDLLTKIANTLEKADNAAKGLGLDSKGITGYSELDKLYFALETAQKEVSNFVFKD